MTAQHLFRCTMSSFPWLRIPLGVPDCSFYLFSSCRTQFGLAETWTSHEYIALCTTISVKLFNFEQKSKLICNVQCANGKWNYWICNWAMQNLISLSQIEECIPYGAKLPTKRLNVWYWIHTSRNNRSLNSAACWTMRTSDFKYDRIQFVHLMLNDRLIRNELVSIVFRYCGKWWMFWK